MNRLIPIGLLIIGLLTAFFMTDRGFTKKESWTLYNASSYAFESLGSQNLLLSKMLQPSEVNEILNQLVDTEKPPLTKQELQQINKDPNAYLTDNILPDGRYLKENYVELQMQMVQELSKPFVYGIEKQSIEQITVTIDQKATLNCERIKVKNGFVLKPITEINSQYFSYIFSDNGSQTVIVLENGIWRIDANSMAIQKIIEMDEDKYSALFDASIKRFGMNQVFPNSFVTANATTEKIAYISNRNSFDDGTNDLFLVDSVTEKETLFKANIDKGENFRPEKWLDDKNLLVYTMGSYGNEFKVFTTDGEVIPLGIDGTIFATSANKIAYFSDWISPTIHIVEFDGDKIIPIIDINLPNQLDTRYAYNKFNSDGSKLVCSYISSDADIISGFIIYDFKSKKLTTVNQFPDDNDYFNSYVWLNQKTLLFTLAKKSVNENDERTFSTWMYHLD